MSEETPDREVDGILSDLDAILSDLGGEPAAAAASKVSAPVQPPNPAPVQPSKPAAAEPPKPAAAEPSKPAPIQPSKPAAAEPPKPVPVQPFKPAAAPPAQPAVLPAAAEPPKPAPLEFISPLDSVSPPPQPASENLSLELGTKAVSKPPEKKPAPKPPPKPAAFVERPPLELTAPPVRFTAEGPAALAPAPVPGPAPEKEKSRPAAAPAAGGLPQADPLPEIPVPANTGKDQVRRVALIYLTKHAALRDPFIRLLDQTAQTVSKKPLFLRRVLCQPVTASCETAQVLALVAAAKPVAVLGLLEGLPEAKLSQLTEALGSAGLMFRGVAAADAAKKAVAVDIIVDMMLLPSE
ncbi:MAG: hypothetical protein PHF00_10025 [Elusimicrobia bacterium]|nr:hypothetical protein [Elusimicrobiota bacterium]